MLAAYAVGQLFFLLGPHPFDPAKYFGTAVEFPDIPADRWTLRSGLIVPVRVAVLLFGPTEAALYAVPLATGLLLTGSVYVLTLRLFGLRVVAACAALIAALNTNYLLNSSFIFPDTTATATVTAGFLLLVLGAPQWQPGSREWAGTASAAAAGVLFGWSCLVREFTPLLLPAVALAVVLLRYPLRRVVALVAATIVTVSFDLLYGLVVFGDPLAHVKELVGHRGNRLVQEELDSVLDVFLLFPRLLAGWRFGWLFIVMAVFFVAALAWLRDRRLWFFASWLFVFWGALVVLGLASLPSGRWLLNVSNIRYWYPALPPLVMGALGGLALLVQRYGPERRAELLASGASAAVAVVVLVPGFVQFDRCAEKDVWRNDPMERWDDLRSWFATDAADGYSTLWTDRLSARLLPAYIRTPLGDRPWDGNIHDFMLRRIDFTQVDPSQSLILVHKDRLRSAPEAQGALEELRGEWSALFVTNDGMMAVLAPSSQSRGQQVAGAEWWNLDPPDRRPADGCGRMP